MRACSYERNEEIELEIDRSDGSVYHSTSSFRMGMMCAKGNNEIYLTSPAAIVTICPIAYIYCYFVSRM